VRAHGEDCLTPSATERRRMPPLTPMTSIWELTRFPYSDVGFVWAFWGVLSCLRGFGMRIPALQNEPAPFRTHLHCPALQGMLGNGLTAVPGTVRAHGGTA
jgi:hypothetical protein